MIINIKAERQKGINPMGDCGPCCLSGVTGVPVQQVYDDFGKIDGMTYDCMLKMCWYYVSHRHLHHVMNDLPDAGDYLCHPRWMTYGRPSWMNEYNWMNHVSASLAGGYIGIAPVNLHGRALQEQMHSNHWVLIVGCDNPSEAANRKVYISCPTKGDFVVNSKDFLMHYGGYNTIWVKPIK